MCIKSRGKNWRTRRFVSTGPATPGKTRGYLWSVIGFPSVRHSPLPLQSFLPLVVPQPPLPLQEFWPLQACFSFLLFVAFLPDSAALSPPVFCAIALALVPATNPERAAPISRARTDFVMNSSFCMWIKSREKNWRTRRFVSTGPPTPGKPELLLFLFHRLSVCPAFTFAFAVVLAFGRTAAALAFAGVLALTGVLFFLALGSLLAGLCRLALVAAGVLRHR